MSPRHLTAVTPAQGDEPTELDSHYPERFLTCRSVGHQWEVVGFYHAYGEVIRSVTCRRCSMDRHDHWSPSGRRIGNRYDQPTGYRIGGGGVTSYDVRREVLNRVTIYDSADAMHEAIFGAKRGKVRA